MQTTTAPSPSPTLTLTRDAFGVADWRALGTSVRILTTDPHAITAARVLVEREIAAIDRAASRFRPDSELARVNGANGRPVRVSHLFATALRAALRAARITAGAVDPTIGAGLVALGYDRDFRVLPLDGPPPLMLRPAPGWRCVQVRDTPPDDESSGSIVQLPPGVQLDLGATAKALAADRAARLAADITDCGVLVSLGGDIAVAGPAPYQGWRVRVADDSAGPTDAPGQTVSIDAGGLATSSTTVRRWRRGGVTWHHLLDPWSGAPAAGPWRTVSVAAGSCVDANAAATAAVVRGAGAEAWLRQTGLPARLVAYTGAVTTIGRWPAEQV